MGIVKKKPNNLTSNDFSRRKKTGNAHRFQDEDLDADLVVDQANDAELLKGRSTLTSAHTLPSSNRARETFLRWMSSVGSDDEYTIKKSHALQLASRLEQ